MIRYYRYMYKKNLCLYYPQVQVKEYFFNVIICGKNYGPYKLVWRRIGQHPQGFGLYNHLDNGKTLTEAKDVIKAYEEYMSKDEPPVDCFYINSSILNIETEKSRNKKPVYKYPSTVQLEQGDSPFDKIGGKSVKEQKTTIEWDDIKPNIRS